MRGDGRRTMLGMEVIMPKFVIERELSGAGKLSPADLQSLSRQSNAVLNEMADVQWVQTWITDDRLYCLYVAPDADKVLEHARRGGFPANRVSQVRSQMDPTTGE